MSFFKFLVRIGNVGSTARTIAKQYKYFKPFESYNGPCNFEVLRMIIENRYRILKNDKFKNELINRFPNTSGLFGLTVEILDVESGYRKNDYKIQSVFNEVIIEELRKKNMSDDEIYCSI